MKTLPLLLILLSSAHAEVTVPVRVVLPTKKDAEVGAIIYSLQLRPLDKRWEGQINPWARGIGLSMMSKYVKPVWTAIDGKPFDDVEAGDELVFWANNSARDIAAGAPNNIFVHHTCTGRTKDRLFTRGDRSIANPYPVYDGPITRENYVGVVAWAGEWRNGK